MRSKHVVIWWLLTCGDSKKAKDRAALASNKAKDGATALASKKAIDRAILYSSFLNAVQT
jgi:hypothetical protein